MDLETKNNIFYKPDVEIERNYSMDGVINKELVRQEETFAAKEISSTKLERIKTKAEETVDELLKIRDVVDILPLDLPKIINGILEPLTILNELNVLELDDILNRDYIDQINEVGVETFPSGVEDYRELKQESSDGVIESTEEDAQEFDIIVKSIAAKSISSQCREQYLKDLTDISSEFSRNLNGAMQGYIYPLSTILNELGLDSPDYLNFEYEGESIKNIPLNLAHLNDRIVIQEAVTAEQNALMVKTHSTSAILDAINAFDAAEALRERYYNESYNMDISSDLDIFNNNLLLKSRESSEEAYRQAKINLFKLLDSSVELMKDISSKKLEAQQAKAILLKNGINIYEHKIFETTGVNNAAGTTNAKNLIGTGGGEESSS